MTALVLAGVNHVQRSSRRRAGVPRPKACSRRGHMPNTLGWAAKAWSIPLGKRSPPGLSCLSLPDAGG